jgi:mono/diheme cytochrome c family protein
LSRVPDGILAHRDVSWLGFPFIADVLMFPTALRFAAIAVIALAGALPASAKLPPELLAQLPAPATRPIDFAKDIQPIFEASCVQCHARGKDKGGFSLETRADFLEGGESGVVAVAGKSAESYVVEMISGLNSEVVMPKKGKKLTRDQIAAFRAWIDQGMRWPEEITFFKHEPANLRPREFGPLPPKPGLENPVDQLVDAYFAKNKTAWGRPVDDRIYARRVWLDAIGLLPPPAELEAFIADTAADKRTRLVQRLLADNQRYAEHWLTFWNDMLRNDYKGTGYTDGGRKQITSWVYTGLARNLPYDQFVAQLINPGAEAEGFANGILWRGAVNASMVPPMQAAQGIAQVFLGVNLKCASCHDSFISEYTLKDSYGLASIYANGPLEIAECDKPTGHVAKVKFLYDDLGAIDADGDATKRRQQLVDVITGRKNGRLPRTVVNRFWQRFMGFGLVEPVDEMDKPAWSPELMDWLAEDLVAHRYDLKQTIARILTSRAYQLDSVNLGETNENYVFRGPAVRRLTAEQFSDAIFTITRQNYAKLDGKLNRLAALSTKAEPLPLTPKWIWIAPDAQVKAKPATAIFRRTVTLPAAPTEAHFAISADDNYTIKINGKAAGASAKRNSTYADWVDVKSALKAGENTIEVTVANLPPDDGRLASFTTDSRPDPDSPAGLILYAWVRANDTVADFVSDHTWTASSRNQPIISPAPGGTSTVDAEPAQELGHATELGGVDLAPWKLGAHFMEIARAPKDTLPVQRASLVAADPLMAALGRPNREQVMTVRQSTATTLQALELTNGATLAKLIRQGVDKILATNPPSSAALIDSLYEQSLCRKPTAAEQTIAVRLVGGSSLRCEGVEDFLWALTMLPEFQLIR